MPGGDHRPGSKPGSMGVEHSITYERLPSRGNVDQTQYAAVRQSLDDGQFTEVLVQCNKHATFGMCGRQNFFVSGIPLPIARPNDVVSGGPQIRDGAAPNTSVKEKFHPSSATSSGSTRSCPTRRRA